MISSGSGARSSPLLFTHVYQCEPVRARTFAAPSSLTIASRPRTSASDLPAQIQYSTVAVPCGSRCTGTAMVASTVPCAMALIDSAPSSASRHVPSAPVVALFPHAYSGTPWSVLISR
jgi:hypothetical protein